MRRVGGALVASMLIATLAAVVTSSGPAVAAQSSPAPRAVGASPAAETAPAARKAAKCPKAKREFKPKRIAISKFGGWFNVVQVGRTGSGEMGTPPLTSSGKWAIGWYPSRGPGSRAGSVPLNAHTWPDGSALGNAMLRKLRKGRIIWLQGDVRAACYKIVKRAAYPRSKAPLKKILGARGKPRLAIIVCSGKRLGPRNWSDRTVWFAVPYTGKFR